MAADELPAELALRTLADRFTAVDTEIRALVAQAPTGNRAALIVRALALLSVLRRDSSAEGGAVGAVLYAYLVSALAVQLLTGRPSPDGARVHQLGRGLALGLDRAILRTAQSTRQALLTVTDANLEEKAMDALTARVDRGGARRQLGAEARMRTVTAARHATTRATIDTLGAGAQVTISPGGAHDCNMNGICKAFQGRTVTVGDSRTRLPPFHPSCGHVASPAGVSLPAHARAQEEAAVTLFS